MLALPTVCNVAPLVEGILASDCGEPAPLMPMADNTKPTNYTGHPALTVPCGKVDGGRCCCGSLTPTEGGSTGARSQASGCVFRQARLDRAGTSCQCS